MTPKWLKLTTTTTGAGNIALTQVSGHPVPSDWIDDQAMLQYVLTDSSNNPVEAGIGTFTTSGATLARTYIDSTYVSGVLTKDGTPTAATLSGTTNVYITPIGQVPPMRGHYSISGGFKCVQGAPAGLGSGSGTATANRQVVAAYRHQTLRRIKGFRIYTGTVSGNCAFSLYRLDANGYPEKRLVYSGSIAVTASQTVYTLPAPLRLPNDWYGVGFSVDNATASWRTCGSSASVTDTPFGVNSSGDSVLALYTTVTSNAHADPFPAGATGLVSGAFPLVNIELD